MGDQNPSLASSLSTRAVGKHHRHLRPRRYGVEEVEGGDSIGCTGKSCQSCTAGVIADCVAVCCCPCAVVNLLALAFLKLPWAVARRCLRHRKTKRNQIIVEEAARKWCEGDLDEILRKSRACEGISGIAMEEEVSGKICAGFEIEEIWYEVGHLGFGRVSFTGVNNLNDEG
ncbi:uncharacterized protein LOC142544139 [Primulina tabacum]|uniref:uncharacterized protein LOC142544139 n=1 Tax=Primulina tabacum TaxID=48773 RepID=UPI003F594159